MQGKRIAITGPTAGIGRETALELARRGAELILFCRNPEKGAALAAEIADTGAPRAQVITMDMASLASVREAGAEFLALDLPLDVLVNNAGVVNTSRRETTDGYEEMLAVNHFAPFLFTGLLLPAIQPVSGARIVNVASDAHAFVRSMNFDDMQAQKNFKTFREYGRSKLANMLFTLSLSQRLTSSSVTVNCLHPGAVSTSLGTQNKGLFSAVLPLLLKPFFRSPERGAETSIYLCCDDSVASVTGRYFANCKQVRAKPWATDEVAAQRLWDYTEACVDFTYPL